MCSNKEKDALCLEHYDLLFLIWKFGGGAMLLPQLRAICVLLNVYPSEQAVGRAVRALREAGIIKRMTWLDGRSDLLIACKYMLRYLMGASSSQEVSGAKRYSTPRRYMTQCCRVDYLIRTIEAHPEIATLTDMEAYWRSVGSTMFLRLTELSEYMDNLPDIAAPEPLEYAAQLAEQRRLDVLRSRLNAPNAEVPPAPLLPVKTIETLHRRSIFVVEINSEAVTLVRYDYTNTLDASRVMDWALDSHEILHALFPNRAIRFCVYALSEQAQADLVGQLGAPYHGLPYQQARLSARHLDSGLSVIVRDSQVMKRWLNGVHILI